MRFPCDVHLWAQETPEFSPRNPFRGLDSRCALSSFAVSLRSAFSVQQRTCIPFCNCTSTEAPIGKPRCRVAFLISTREQASEILPLR